MNTPINHKTVTVKLSRIDLLNAIQAVRLVRDDVGESGWSRWNGVYDTLKDQLAKFDEKYVEKD